MLQLQHNSTIATYRIIPGACAALEFVLAGDRVLVTESLTKGSRYG